MRINIRAQIFWLLHCNRQAYELHHYEMIAFKLFCVVLLAPSLIEARSFWSSLFHLDNIEPRQGCAEILHCGPNDLGHLKPYPPDCEFYIYCDVNQTEVLSRCRTGQHFSPEKNHCLPIAEANCPSCEITTEPPPTTPEPTTVIPECPDTPTCGSGERGKEKPYPPDCRKYVYCDGSVTGTIRTCGSGNHFNPTTNRCASPAQANCPFCVVVTTTPEPITTAEPTTPEPTPEPTTQTPVCPETPTCGSGENGKQKPYPPDCTRYIYCDGTVTGVIRKCSSGNHFNPIASRCANPSQANCPFCIVTTTPQPTTTAEPTTEPATETPECPETPTCGSGENGKSKPYPPDCTKYVYCDGTVTGTLRKCTNGNHFNPTTNRCVSPAQANCPYCIVITTLEPETTTPEPTTVIPECPETPTCGSGERGKEKPYPPDCRRYVYCDGTVTGTLRNCSNGNHFNPTTNRCASPAQANCPYCVVTEPPTTAQPNCPEIPTCLPEEAGLTKSYPPDCSRYIYCGMNGTYSLRRCQTDNEYSPTLQRCVALSESDCPFCIVITTTEVPTTQAATCPPIRTCSIETAGATYAYPPNCNLYIYCNDDGQDELSMCPFERHFNEELGACIDPSESNCVDCGDNEVTTVQSAPMCEEQQSCVDSSQGATLPVIADCTKYIYCDGTPEGILSTCYNGRHYSITHGSCMPIAEADCIECEES